MTLELNRQSEVPAVVPTETEAYATQTITETQRAFAANIFKAYQNVMSTSERLSALYQIDRDTFEEEVDDAVEEYLNEDEDFQEFFARFRKARQSGSGDSFVPEMRERRSKARELIIASLNLPENSQILGVEEATKNIENILKDIPKEPENIDVALNTLGIKTPLEDEPGQFEYSFPYDLLPEKINDKWKEYLNTVLIHVETAKNATPDTKEDVVVADRTRKIAHNAITKNVHEILQLDQFGFGMDDTRHLLSRVRNDELTKPSETPVDYHPKTLEEIKIARKLSRSSFGH